MRVSSATYNLTCSACAEEGGGVEGYSSPCTNRRCSSLTTVDAIATAEEMLERALYALEMAWHPSFSPAAASMHVPYDEANAPLFICLFR